MSTVLDEVLEGLEPSPELVSVMAGSKPAAVLAIDVGTSGVRASLFDERGRAIEGTTVRLQSRHFASADLAQTDADTCFELVGETLDALFDNPLQTNIRVEFIAISCFWQSLIGVDTDGAATTPIYSWAETRASSVARELATRFDEEAIHARTGCRFHPSYWPAKLVFLRTREPETFKRTRRWLSFGDYVMLRLFGETAASVSMASGTGLFNQRALDWDCELVEQLEIPRESLPKISNQGQTFQGMTAEYRARWPQLSEARVFPPIGDGAANTIGSGCTSPDRVALMIGTSGAMRVLYAGEPPAQPHPGLWCYRADHERVIVGGALSDGGSLYHWIRDSLFITDTAESLEAALDAMEPDSHGLTVLPFWSGERSTGWSAESRGAILGLSLRTEPIEILRASMEAVAYRFAQISQALEPFAPDASIIASGTALRCSPVWAQIIADVLGRSITISEAAETSARGAALLALEAAGRIQSIEEFPLAEERTFAPNQLHYERYQEGIARQNAAYERIIGVHETSRKRSP